VSVQGFVLLAIKASIFLVVLGLGLGTSAKEATYLFRHPGLLIRSIAAMNVAMPVFVVAAAMWIPLPQPIRIALVAISLSPVPPLLPGKQERAGGPQSYAVGLLVAASVLSLVLLPVGLELIGRFLDRDVRVPWDGVVPVLLLSVLLPLSIGIALRWRLPVLARRAAKPVTVGGIGLLVLAVVPVLGFTWPLMRSQIGQGVLIVLVLFTVVGLLVGHALGGPDPDHRTVLALAAATRHPGVAIALATLNFPAERAVPAVVMLHVIVGAVVSLPYLIWRKRRHDAASRS
jgi:BASS family bile acid:Na+ symporter